MKKLGTILVVLIFAIYVPCAFAQDEVPEAETVDVPPATGPPPKDQPKASSLADLLKSVQGGWSGERKENREREARFKQARDEQAQLLAKAKATRAAEEARSEALESQFEANEIALTTLEDTLTERLGALGELFGVVRQVSGDMRSQVEASVVSAQLPGRAAFLEELGKNKSLPSIESLEKLWFIMHQEMTELGNVARFNATVVSVDGEESQREVIRVGAFNAIADGIYLVYEDGKTRWDLPGHG
jgi:biopolymer transport protein ExbB